MPLKNKCVCCKQWLLGVNCKEECFFLGVFFQHFHLFSFQIIFSAFNKMIYYLIISRINICIVSEVKGREWLLSFKKLEMPFTDKKWSPGYFLQLIFAVRLAIIKLQDSLDSFKMHNDTPMCNLQRSSFSRCHWVRLEWHCVKIPNFTVLKGCLQSGTKQNKSGLYGYYCPSLSTLLLPPWVTGPSPFHCVCAAGAFIFKNKLFD